MIGRQGVNVDLTEHKNLLRPFLRSNPGLPAYVRAEQFARMVGRDPNPVAIVRQALEQDPNSTQLCQLLSSPLGQAALQALAIEFPPTWSLVFQLLPVAAETICKAKSQGSNSTAIGVGALIVGAGLLLFALSDRKAA